MPTDGPAHTMGLMTLPGSGYGPLAPGIRPQRRYGYEGVPGMSGLGGMIGQPFASAAMGNVGMVPTGLMHDQNTFDSLMQIRFTQMQLGAMRLAAEQDRRGMMHTFRGLAAVTGTPFGAEQRRAATSLSGMAAAGMPIFADLMPEFIDQMAGMRGSATVMASRIMDHGRYRVDPVTGRAGLSSETAVRQVRTLMNDMLSNENLHRMQGVTAGGLGNLYGELQSRGMLRTGALEGGGPFGSNFRRNDTVRALNDLAPDVLRDAAARNRVTLGDRGVAGISGEDVDRLRLDPSVADRLRSFDAGRVRRSLQSYIGAVAAMRDIFGDMGQSNAPMSQLMQGLEALTMGSAHQVSPTRVAGMVRQTYNLARMTGVPMENALALQQHTAARAGQLGLESIFAVQATQGALSFGGAYRGLGMGATPAWNLMTADQLTQLDSNLRVQASGSNMANRVGLLMRVQNTMGGFEAGSDADRLSRAVQTGLTTWTDASGRARQVNMGDRDLLSILGGASNRGGTRLGLSEGDLRDMLGQRDSNREFAESVGAQDLVRRAQATEVQGFVGSRMQEVLAARLRDRLVAGGMSAPDANRRAREAAGRVSGNVTRQMFGMSTDEFRDHSTFDESVGGFIGQELEAAGMGGLLAGMSDTERRSFLSVTAQRFRGHADRAIGTSPYRSFRNLTNMHATMNSTVLNEADARRLDAHLESRMQESMSGLGRGTLLQRVVSGLQSARPGDDAAFGRIVASALGGTPTSELQTAMMDPLREIHRRQLALDELRDQVGSASGEERETLMGRFDTLSDELRGRVQELVQLGERHGVFSSGPDMGSAAAALRSLDEVAMSGEDMAGMRGMFGNEVTAAQRDSVRRRVGGSVSEGEARAVIEGRRLDSINRLAGGAALDSVDAGTRGMYNATLANIRSANPGLNDSQLRMATVGYLRDNYRRITPEELQVHMGRLPELSDAEADALVRHNRRTIPMRADDATIAAVMAENPTMSRDQAVQLANARLRANRLGVGPEGGTTVEAIRATLSGRVAAFDTITNEQRNDFLAVNPISDAQRTEFRRLNPGMATATDAAVNNTIADRGIRASRAATLRGEFDAFWRSEDGDRVGDEASNLMEQIDYWANQSISSPHMVDRFGGGALDMGERLRASQTRLQEMAYLHSGGDVGRLLMGDFTEDLMRDPERRRAAEAERDRILNDDVRPIFQRLSGSMGREGRQWELGSERAALTRVLDRDLAAGRITAADRDRLLRDGLADPDRARVETRMRESGSEANARRILGLPESSTLSAWQRGKVSAIQQGAGSDTHIRAALGLAATAVLTDEQRTQARMGTGGDEVRARQLLFDPVSGRRLSEVGRDLTDEENERVRAVAGGLATDAHARFLAGFAPGAVLTTEQMALVRGIRQGMGSETTAREQLGLPASAITPEMRDRVRAEQFAMGDAATARRLMGVTGTTVPEARREEFERTQRQVSVARRLNSDQESLIARYTRQQSDFRRQVERSGLTEAEFRARHPHRARVLDEMGTQVDGIAGGLGVSREEVIAAGGVTGRLHALRRRREAEGGEDPMTLTRRIFGEYGFTVPAEGSAPTARMQEVAGMLNNPRAQGLARSLLESRRVLRERATRGGRTGDSAGIDTMVTEYMRASETSGEAARRTALRNFQTQYGFDADDRGDLTGAGNRQWADFQRSVRLQQQSRFAQLGSGGSRRIGETGLPGMIGDMIRHGEPTGPGATGPGGGGGGRMEIGGTLRITGDGMGTLVGAWGSSRGHTPPPG